MKRPMIFALMLSLLFLTTGFASERKTAVFAMEKAGEQTHQVSVVDGLRITIMGKNSEEISKIPKLIVDGKEAAEINSSISKLILEKYPMELTDYGYIDGYSVSYDWGVRGNIVSIVIYADYLSEDSGDYVVFNYNLDTLKALKDEEVVKMLGMTDKQFFSKTADAYRKYWKDSQWLDINNAEDAKYLDKSIKAINYDKTTPYITPGGNPGVLGTIYLPHSQFDHSERCFNLALLDAK